MRTQTQERPQVAGGALDSAPTVGDRAPQEPWLGRLRYVIVPMVAVAAIIAVIYLLQDKSEYAVDSAEAGAAGFGGAAQAVQVPLLGALAGTPGPRVGSSAPQFTLNDLDGRPVKLSEFRGRAIFLNFFASWCPPCRAEMPDILATYEENKMKGAVVVAVDLQEEAQTVRNYAETVGLTFPIVLDRTGQVSALYRITAIPTSFFIDREGIVRDMQIGAMSKATMQNRLNKALGGAAS